MKSRITAFLFISAFAARTISAAPAETPLLLRGNVRALIAGHSLLVPDRAGKYQPAPRGSYQTNDGKSFNVAQHGHLADKDLARLKTIASNQKNAASNNAQKTPAQRSPAPAPPRPSVNWGAPHQTGSHL